MAESSECEGAETGNLLGLEPDIRERLDKRTDFEDLRLGGVVCRFEQVRGRGAGEVSRLAELQHGHVHRQQLSAAGVKRGAVAHQIRTGRLHRTLPCVFLVGRPQRTELGRMMAAALHFKGDALVAGRAAAQAWSVLDTTQMLGGEDPIDVLLVGRNAEQPQGVRIHRTRSLARQDIRWRNGIPVTSPARTLLDLAASMDEWELEAVLSVALGKNVVRNSQLEDVTKRNQGVKGIAKLRSLLEQTESLHDTRSGYERKLLTLLKQAELPLPITNIKVAGKLVDAFWPDLGLVLEFDSWTYHGGRSSFETDRLRDQHVTAAGHHVIRITARQIDHTPYALTARIATTMANLRLSSGDLRHRTPS